MPLQKTGHLIFEDRVRWMVTVSARFQGFVERHVISIRTASGLRRHLDGRLFHRVLFDPAGLDSQANKRYGSTPGCAPCMVDSMDASWLIKWRGSSYRLNFDLHRASGF